MLDPINGTFLVASENVVSSNKGLWLYLRNAKYNGNCLFLKCCRSVTANRTATVKENCHFGLLFDHSSYMEAAAASIRAMAVGGWGRGDLGHRADPTLQPSDSPKSCASGLIYWNILETKREQTSYRL